MAISGLRNAGNPATFPTLKIMCECVCLHMCSHQEANSIAVVSFHHSYIYIYIKKKKTALYMRIL